MEKDYEELIVKRCTTALNESLEYKSIMSRKHEEEEIQDIEQRICYMKGYNDAIKTILCSKFM